MKTHKKLALLVSVVATLGIIGTVIAAYTKYAPIDNVTTTSHNDYDIVFVNHDYTLTYTTSTDEDSNDEGEIVNNPVTHSRSGPGTFEPATGTSVTWTAPSATANAAIAVAANDSPLANDSPKADDVILTVQNVIYVDEDATGNDHGTTWANAFNNLQDALDVATSRSEIWVAEGTYYPDEGQNVIDNNKNETFLLVEELEMYGGFDPGSGDDTWAERDYVDNKTILSGDIDKDDVLDSDNSYHVVKGAENANLDGFTITGGNAHGPETRKYGGGLYQGQGMTISNCTFTQNSAYFYGGGIYAPYGSCEVNHCIFSDCDAFTGGAVCFIDSGQCTIKNSFFIDNSARYGGGAVHFDTTFGTIVNCTFTRNKAENYGGALWLENFDISTTVVNCTFYANDSNDQGGGIWLCNDDTTITNCVLWGNTDNCGSHDEYDQIYISGEDPTISYCCIQDEPDDDDIPFPGAGPGRTDDHPNFVDDTDPDGDDDQWATSDDGLTLDSGSPCIDAADNSAISEPKDITGATRKVDGDGDQTVTVDMGAYEYQGS